MVLAPVGGQPLDGLVDLSPYDGDRIEVLRQRSAGELHAAMRLLPGVDLVIDARVRDEERQWRRWRRLFFHLHPGGTWVARRGPQSTGTFAEKVGGLHHRTSDSGLGKRLLEPARAIADVVVSADRVTVSKRGTHLLKLRDLEAPAVLASRAPDLRVTELDRVDGGRLDTAGRVTSHGHASDELTAPIDYPSLHLRRYDGRVSLLTGAVAAHGTTLLPDTYRWHLQDVPVNKRLVDIDADWARTRHPETPTTHLPGAYYYFDYKNVGHYGHLMTEALSRLWGWPRAKAEDPELKILLRRSARDAHSKRPRAELTLLPAFGIEPDDLVWVDEAVTVDSLVGLTPMWHNQRPYSAHPGITDVWRRLRDGLPVAEVPAQPKIFVTRREGGHRHCHNTAEVEQLFSDHGFHIVEPSALAIPAQAATFAQARVVAGFGGTGMFNLVFARDLEQVIVLNHTAYDARNEHLFGAVLGAKVDYFWSEPDLPPPPGGWSYDSFHSPWTFDIPANLEALTAVMGART